MVDNEYLKISERAENVLYMLKFLNYAYNQPDSDLDLAMTNEEKTGGQLMFFDIIETLEQINNDIKKLLEKQNK